MKTPQSTAAFERVVLVGVTFKRGKRIPAHTIAEQGQDSLDELVELARSAGADVATPAGVLGPQPLLANGLRSQPIEIAQSDARTPRIGRS